MRITFNRFWLAYTVWMMFVLLACAAFCATSDGWVRLDGWLAVCLGLSAVLQWYELEQETKRGPYGE